MGNFTRFAAAGLTGVALAASFPPIEAASLAWVALVPLFLALEGSTPGQAFLAGLCSTVVCNALALQWLARVPGFPPAGFVLMLLVTGSFTALCCALLVFARRRTGWPTPLLAPALWVASEFARANFFFLASPWLLLGYSHHRSLPLLQTASLASVYGLSFVTVLVNAALAGAAVEYTRHRRAGRGFTPRLLLPLSASVLVVVALNLWGAHRLREARQTPGGAIAVTLVQPNIDQDEKWSPAFRERTLAQLAAMTRAAASRPADLIVWPETAVPGYLPTDPVSYAAVRDLLKELGTPLLLGSAANTKIKRQGATTFRYRNSAFLLDPKGRIAASYDKVKLLPFSEYLPFEGIVPWPDSFVVADGYFTPGTRTTIMEVKGAPFGVTICWENFFPGFFRQFVSRGARFMVNLTNEGWSGTGIAPALMLPISVFRAVETGVPFVRCANSGLSCLIDPLGRVVGIIGGGRGGATVMPGTLTAAVPPPIEPPFYARHGDVFALICVAATSLVLVRCCLPASWAAPRTRGMPR